MANGSHDLRGLTPEKRAALAERGPAHELPLWREAFAAYDWVLLRTSTVYFGFGIPRGDGSAVVTIPGFLGTDTYLVELRGWLRRVGYRPYRSQIGRNADCPNRIVQRLLATVERACDDTGHRVHLVGHSLGGVIARSAAAIRPDRIASVVTLGAPFRGIRSHPIVLHTRDVVRRFIVGHQSSQYLPAECYTGHCTCEFLDGLTGFPSGVAELAVYSRRDGVVDWRMCVTGDPRKDREVLGTHVGMAFNPFVYRQVAEFLAGRARLATPRPASDRLASAPDQTRAAPSHRD